MKKWLFMLFWMTILGFASLEAQTEWVWQSPLPQGNSLNDAWTFNGSAFIGIGVDGTYIQTDDGGLNWDLRPNLNGLANDLLSIFFLDDSTGWIAGENGTLLRTVDRGGHWIGLDTGFSDDFEDIQFIDSENGWIVGRWGTILHTVDGGTVWSTQESGTYRNLRSVFFLDTLKGWAVGHGGTILSTNDGGAIWQSRTSNTLANLWSVQFVNPDTGWTVGQDSTILKTVNGGTDWLPQSGGAGYHLSSIHFSDPDSGLAVGFTGYLDDFGALQKQTGIILKTADGGQLWTRANSTPILALNAVNLTDTGIAWAVGITGSMLQTMDHGDTWESRSKGIAAQLSSVFFVDPDTGWAVGSGQVFKTEDGGETWTMLPNPLGDEPNRDSFSLGSLQFLNAKTGYMTASFYTQTAQNLEMIGMILQTQDGGVTWTKQRRENYEYFFDVQMLTPDTGFALGAWVDFTAGSFKPKVLKTTTGGAIWEPLTAKLPASIFYSLDFIDSQTGWLTGENTSIYKTIDGGLTWKGYKTGVSGVAYQSVDFYDAINGWAVGPNGIVIASTNGGLNWRRLATNSSDQLTSLDLVDNKTVWVTGANGTVLNTLDGGETWTRSQTNTSNAFLGVCFPTPSTGWVVGENGSIIKTVNGQTAVEEPSAQILPRDFALEQNFPNPFNPTTTIRFSMPMAGETTLKLYNLLGKEVAVLAQGRREAGTYQVSFDAEHLPSGVYFYRLEAGDHIQTRKLVIQK